MIREMQGKEITVTVPKKRVMRVRKMKVDGPRTKEPKYVWNIDFRGIRSGNCTRKPKKGWKFAGSSYAFDSPEQLQKLVDGYFNSCFGFRYDKLGNIMYDKDGEPIRYQARPFTVSGLSLHLGVSTRTFHQYSTGKFDQDFEGDKDSLLYKEILVKARQKIEAFAEENLYSKDTSFGAKFVLDSAFGWCTTKEQAEIEKMKFESWIRNKEFELKQQLTQMGQEDTGLEIRIVRKGQE